ncbi:DoxX family protein [Sulfurovum lithotrophicum]|nr:DoxX family protein [Sulfurovum lithotrophicum]
MFKNLIGEISVLFSYPKHLFMLAARLLLAYGFAKPALMKLQDMTATAHWFASMSIPFPTFTAYLVSAIETIGIILLVLGLFTRPISLLLSFVMMGAMIFVHSTHGFSVADNGLEIPLYYMLFLFILASFGGGKYALDNLLFKDGNDE